MEVSVCDEEVGGGVNVERLRLQRRAPEYIVFSRRGKKRRSYDKMLGYRPARYIEWGGAFSIDNGYVSPAFSDGDGGLDIKPGGLSVPVRWSYIWTEYFVPMVSGKSSIGCDCDRAVMGNVKSEVEITFIVLRSTTLSRFPTAKYAVLLSASTVMQSDAVPGQL